MRATRNKAGQSRLLDRISSTTVTVLGTTVHHLVQQRRVGKGRFTLGLERLHMVRCTA
jgi:hypothetical protein